MTYNFTQINDYGNPFWGLMVMINEGSNFLFVYLLMALFFIVSSYVIMRKTQDISKSLLMGTHITTMLTLIMFFMGLVSNVNFVPEIVMLSLLIIEAISIGLIYFNRRATE